MASATTAAPSAAKKAAAKKSAATKPAAKKVRSFANQVLRFTYQDDEIFLPVGSLGATEYRVVREELGEDLGEMLDRLVTRERIFETVAGLWWLARRQNEPDLAYSEAEAQVTFDSTPRLDVVDIDDMELPATPES